MKYLKYLFSFCIVGVVAVQNRVGFLFIIVVNVYIECNVYEFLTWLNKGYKSRALKRCALSLREPEYRVWFEQIRL